MEYGNSRETDTTPAGQYFSSENPVFKIKLRSLQNDYEEKQFSSPDQERLVKFKIGAYVSGKSLKNRKEYKGRIVKINLQDKIVIISSEKDKKRIKLDIETLKNVNTQQSTLDLPFTYESAKYVMDFDEFCASL